MTLNAKQQSIVSASASSHLLLKATATDVFHWFQQAVAGVEAKENIDSKLSACDALLAEDADMHVTMKNEWSLFGRSLKTAYTDFGRDIVHRMGADDCSHVRNLALNTAAGAFSRLNDRARSHMINQVEALAA